MNDEETEKLELLLDEHGKEGVSLTRRDPDNSGPLLVQWPNGHSEEV